VAQGERAGPLERTQGRVLIRALRSGLLARIGLIG
jgi:hypothetical protein